MNRSKASIESAALKRLEEYDFPGNVRELENMIERALVIGNSETIRLKDLPIQKDSSAPPVESLNENEKRHIQTILDKYSWNISRAAKVLKVDRATLYNKIKKYDLKPATKENQ